MKFIKTKLIVFSLSLLFFIIFLYFLKPILTTNSLMFPYAVHPFDIAKKFPEIWFYLKTIYCINLFITTFLIINSIFTYFNFNKINIKKEKLKSREVILKNTNLFNLLIGTNSKSNENIYIPEKGLYQNILVTGTIGSRKNKLSNVPIS